MRWWAIGLIVGVLAVVASVFRRSPLPGWVMDASLWETLPVYAAGIFCIGFVCGALACSGKWVYRRLGMAGDALTGAAVAGTALVGMTLLDDPSAWASAFRGDAVVLTMVLAAGAFIGMGAGSSLRRPLLPPDA